MELDYSLLFNYGVIGLWLVYMVWREHHIMKSFVTSLDRNTEALEALITLTDSIKQKIIIELERRDTARNRR